MRRRVMVLTRDVIPLPDRPTTGGGLRAWGLGEALKIRGHDVVYSVPRRLVPEGEAYDELRRFSFEPEDLHATLLRSEADVVLVEQWGLGTHLQEVNLPVILDLHGSLILENAFRQHRSLTSNAAAKIKVLRRADLVVCPAVRQRTYFMAWMMMAGVDPVKIPIEVVPVSMSPELPERSASYEGPLALVYGGQLWPWILPETGLRAATSVLEETGAGTLHLFVNEPQQMDILPFDDSTRVPAWVLPSAVRDSNVVRLEGMVARQTMLDRYRSAHLAVDLYARNTERELAYTTRTVEYMWCGLPVLYGDYGELSDLIRKYEAGWVVSPSDPEGVRAALMEALTDRDELRRRSDNARRLVQENLVWDRTIEPLDRYIQDPVIRTKGETIFGMLALEFDRIKAETEERIKPMERDLKNLVEEVATRDTRLTSLQDELLRRERIAEEESERYRAQINELERERWHLEERLNEMRFSAERHTLEVTERDREIRQLGVRLAESQEQLVQGRQELEQVRERFHLQEEDLNLTSARCDQLRSELTHTRRQLEEGTVELLRLRTDIKGAVAGIASQRSESEARIEELEEKISVFGQSELELRRDLAAEASSAEDLRARISTAQREKERLTKQVQNLQRRLGEMRNTWLERTMATGLHSWRRVAIQVPKVAGLWVRNLANNAYMTVWQKRHNIRIFPGQ